MYGIVLLIVSVARQFWIIDLNKLEYHQATQLLKVPTRLTHCKINVVYSIIFTSTAGPCDNVVSISTVIIDHLY